MRIAVIVRSLKFGGMERDAYNQADAFVQAGHDVDLIYFSNKNKEINPRERGEIFKNIFVAHTGSIISNLISKNNDF